MKILLISQNREKVPYPVLPIGLCAVAEALEQRGHHVAMLDLCFARDTAQAIERRVRAFAPELIGIGVRNMDNCDYYAPKDFVGDARRIVGECRRVSRAPILLGGSAVGVMPGQIMEAVRPDYAIHGDGELAAVEFAKALEEKRDPSEIPGVCAFRDGAVRVNPQWRVPALNASGPPRIYRWVDTRQYMKYEGVYPLQSKRGCALKCVYCT